MKKIIKILTSRMFLFGLAVAVQFVWMYLFYTFLNNWLPWLDDVMAIAAVIIVLVIVNRQMNTAFRLVWTLLILAMPVFGVMFYLLYGNSRLKIKLRRRSAHFQEVGANILQQNMSVQDQMHAEDPEAFRESVYLLNTTGFPLYANETAKYYAVGDDAFTDMIEALEDAKQYIFMEYFIIAPGVFWNTIHEILKRKVKEGVEVRVLYDDFGCAGTLPYRYFNELEEEGIRCACFNPMHFLISLIMNNRDHRKILVVDGETAFTGGFNIADEYINSITRFGHWKDAGIRVTGSPAWSFTSMFLQMWSLSTGETPEIDFYKTPAIISEKNDITDGYAQPYSDMPLDNEAVGENVYLQLISRAQKYVYIFTPYLIITDEMKSALTIAGQRGVDIRIVTPHIPDKKLVFLITQSTYRWLLEAGVRIYEYTPGFIHSKVMVSDDRYAVVGSINLDYRSLYQQYEDAVWFCGASVVKDIARDALNTFESSQEITLYWVRHRSIFLRALMSFLNLFAPLT
jgi:cardiolipin synthase